MEKRKIEFQEKLKYEIQPYQETGLINPKDIAFSLNQQSFEKELKKYKIDEEQLLEEAIKIVGNEPTKSDLEIKIELLHKVAKNKKFKLMADIAQKMIDEKWWKK